ncbi:hypothetical protein [Rhodanobacter sp. KK11]|jgi:hypothetical protein|uniref:hypothetical protein n=1 Tax=Rhodanobacter sp. KK11 TaxID=3083255 RepID=UPI00296721D5|nr:hypothetical protein [Rhodanobacter sp. KK11]MDW2981767.1 hypothetical protein [Rhodanobacter sp. KK11]
MTQIDAHTLHTSRACASQNPPANRGQSQNFLDHLLAGKHDAPEKGSRQDRGLPRDSKSPSATWTARDVVRPQPQVQGQALKYPDERENVDEVFAEAPDLRGAGGVLSLLATHCVPSASTGTVACARVFEQHGFANGYLSFIADVPGAGILNERHAVVSAAVGQAPAAEVPDSTTGLVAVPAAGDRHFAVATPWPVVVEGMDSVAGTTTRSVERLARTLGPFAAANQPWPERLLRLSGKSDGRTSLWIRDYALPSQAVQPLVAQLRQLALKEGIALDRVMVNGTVVWHAESFQGDV